MMNETGPVDDPPPLKRADKPEQPGFGQKMIDEQAGSDERQGGFGAELYEQGKGERQQRHLADRRVAEKTLRVGLPEADQVRDYERNTARDGDEFELPFEER